MVSDDEHGDAEHEVVGKEKLQPKKVARGNL